MNDVPTDSRTFFSLRAPKCVATSTFTPLPRPIRKPVKRKTSVVVEPTEPMAAELEKRPTTARSTILKSICRRFVNISGMEKAMICRLRRPSVILSVLLRAKTGPSFENKR